MFDDTAHMLGNNGEYFGHGSSSGIGELGQLLKLLPRLTGVNRLRGKSDPVLNVRGPTADEERRAAVEQNHIARRTLVAGQHAANDLGALLGAAAVKIFQLAALETN